MPDLVPALTAQIDATLDVVTQLVTEIQKNVGQLQTLQQSLGSQATASDKSAQDLAAQIGEQIARLKMGSDAALSALRALQNPDPVGASTAAPAAPAADVPGPAAVAQAPTATSPDPAPAAVAGAASADGLKA